MTRTDAAPSAYESPVLMLNNLHGVVTAAGEHELLPRVACLATLFALERVIQKHQREHCGSDAGPEGRQGKQVIALRALGWSAARDVLAAVEKPAAGRAARGGAGVAGGAAGAARLDDGLRATDAHQYLCAMSPCCNWHGLSCSTVALFSVLRLPSFARCKPLYWCSASYLASAVLPHTCGDSGVQPSQLVCSVVRHLVPSSSTATNATLVGSAGMCALKNSGKSTYFVRRVVEVLDILQRVRGIHRCLRQRHVDGARQVAAGAPRVRRVVAGAGAHPVRAAATDKLNSDVDSSSCPMQTAAAGTRRRCGAA